MRCLVILHIGGLKVPPSVFGAVRGCITQLADAIHACLAPSSYLRRRRTVAHREPASARFGSRAEPVQSVDDT